MDDLLASIRRAIHDEVLDGPEEAPDGGRAKALDRHPPGDRRSADSQDIVALRNKISRELVKDEPAAPISIAPLLRPVAAPQPAPPPQTPPLPQATPLFRTLLGGDEHLESLQPVAALQQAERPGAPESLEAPAERPGAHGRPTVLPTAPRRPPAPVYPARSAYDPPGRNGTAYRPPFGQSSAGIRNFQPPPRPPASVMISPEASNVTASSFSRLAEQMFAREGGERSIDDLARELLHPMLKQWLDQNLPRIVEQLVREEIERVARRGGR
jgi:cell pole-organizing protein PopZ